MKSRTLLTIGYQGRQIEEFLACIKSLEVTRLIDVREIPHSRKKGYSKRALEEGLREMDVEYVHMPVLGSPADARKRLKVDRNYGFFFEAYEKHLEQHRDAIGQLHSYVCEGVNCLMCYEESAEQCHRSVVAEKVKECNGNGLKIRHI